MARGDFASAKQDQFVLRLPDGMRDELKAAAKDAGRSMNAEIIARLSGLDTVGLRDRFAGQALAGYFAAPHTPHQNADRVEVAEYIYRMADAMLAAREARS